MRVEITQTTQKISKPHLNFKGCIAYKKLQTGSKNLKLGRLLPIQNRKTKIPKSVEIHTKSHDFNGYLHFYAILL
jgi:hypothetical protein